MNEPTQGERVNPDRDLPPMRKGRVIASYVALYLVYVAIASWAVYAVVGLNRDSPLWQVAAVCTPICLVVWLLGARLLRPWYRPAPKREQWTEDQL